MLASPGLLTPAFVACSTNAGDGLVKPFSCSVVHGRWVDGKGTFQQSRLLHISFLAVDFCTAVAVGQLSELENVTKTAWCRALSRC